jgi:hypothetical protein
VVAPGLDPLLGRRRMVGDEDRVEPGRLRRRRHLPDRAGSEELLGGGDSVGREAEGEPHHTAGGGSASTQCVPV